MACCTPSHPCETSDTLPPTPSGLNLSQPRRHRLFWAVISSEEISLVVLHLVPASTIRHQT